MSKIMDPIEWLATKGINVESGIVKDAISAERLQQYGDYYHAEKCKPTTDDTGFTVKTITMHECHCSQCGNVFHDGEGHTQWLSEQHLSDWVSISGWQRIDGKWWCNKCIYENNLKDEQ